MYNRINELLGTKYKSDEDISWGFISSNQILSEDFIREFKNEVNWDCISIMQVLSEPFIKEFKDKVDWNFISAYQVLSEDFIREFKEEVNWKNISFNQLLSWDFILEFKDRVDWFYVSSNQPYIDFNYEKVDKFMLRDNQLYNIRLKNKNSKWFIGYLEDISKNFESKRPLFFNLTPKHNFVIKSKIYWRDLKLISRVDKFKIIRKIKHV